MRSNRFLPVMLVILVLLMVILACGSTDDDDVSVIDLVEPDSKDEEEGDIEVPEVQVTDTLASTPTTEIEGLIKIGTHLVGTDIQPGIYVGFTGEGIFESCYWARLSDLSGDMDALLANDNAEGLFYIEVLPTDKALETGCELLPIDSVPARDELLTVLSPSTYLVGRDIEPGTYRGEAGEDILESCYWARLSGVSGDMGEILANDNATGQYFIEVKPTDFALDVGCEVEKME